MTEAVQGACCFAFDHLRLHRVEAATLPHNIASQGVLRKIGFREEGLARRYLKIDGKLPDHRLFELLREEFGTAPVMRPSPARHPPVHLSPTPRETHGHGP